VLSEPLRERWDVDAIELLSKYRLTPQLENWQKVGGSRSGRFPSSSAFVTVDSWRSDGDIQHHKQLSAAFAGAKCAIV